MDKFLTTSALVCTLATLPAFAETASINPDASASDELVVVANRHAESRDRIGNSVTVLNQAAIEASQAVSVPELLVQTPGITFIRNGGAGENTSILIRGADTDQTVVLLDGVKLNDPSTPGGQLNFGHFLLGDISRIEILRGPQSTLWGSDAMGGVLNIVTAQPTSPFSADGQIEGGSRDTGYFRGGVGMKSDPIDWRLAGGYFTTAGISAFDKKFGGRELDGYRNGAISGTAVLHVADNIALDQRFYYIDARNDADGTPAPLFALADTPEYGKAQNFIDYTGLNVDLLDGKLQNRLSFQYTDTDGRSYNPLLSVPLTFQGIGNNTRFEYQGAYDIDSNFQAVFGLASQSSDLKTLSPSVAVPNPKALTGTAEIDSLYGQIHGTVLPGLTLTGGVRGDHHQTFGDHATGQAAAAWSFNDGNTILRASFGQGFKAPSLYQLFSQYGNSSLSPQEDDGWDAGIEQHFLDGRIALQATYFGRSTDNVIGFVSCFGSANPRCKTQPSGFYSNTAKAEAQGVELQAAANVVENLTVSANYTYAQSQDKTVGAATFDKNLVRRPRNAANASVTYVWPFGLSTSAAIRYSGRSFENTSNTVVLGSYTLIDLRVSYPINDNFELYGRIENLGDVSYETAYKYGQPGRGAFAGVKARF